MLKLDDFLHLPQISTVFNEIVTGGTGLIIVAGLDPRPAVSGSPGGFLPSGRSTIFRILVREILTAQPDAECIVIAKDREAVRVPRQLRSRVKFWIAGSPDNSYTSLITRAAQFRPALLVIDHLTDETVLPALYAGQAGVRILTQLETVFRGTEVIRHLEELGAEQEHLSGLSWIFSVQRLNMLCPRCKTPVLPEPAQINGLRQRYPHLSHLIPGSDSIQQPWFESNGCALCDQSGQQGEVMAFDVFHAHSETRTLIGQPSTLPLEEYVLRLGLAGYLSLEDVLLFETDLFRRTYHMLMTSEITLAETNTRLERKLLELETANRVLEQRTQALISLGEIGQALISSTDLDDMAGRVCRHACDLCGADRAILYLLHAGDLAEVLAVAGWSQEWVHQRFNLDFTTLNVESSLEPVVFFHRPPGIPYNAPDMQSTLLRAGLYVPLAAQRYPVGFMVVHSTQKTRFEPGQIALLQTFANHAAVAMQRAGLIHQLRAKITQLEAAQVELAKKERFERELELARQVQQSVLPRTFPQISGYQFAARNEPARTVGGDFYDVIVLDEDHFGIAIADVSDKGMPAALYMALTRSLLHAEARRERSPRLLIENVNQLLLELGEPNMFVTVFYGVMERTTRRLTYTRSGHDRPLLAHQGTVSELGGRGVALGLFDPAHFRVTEEEITLAAGDHLLLYTDGLTDIQSPDGSFFGKESLKMLLQSNTDRSPDQLCEQIFAGLHLFQSTADQYDDMTMLLIALD